MTRRFDLVVIGTGTAASGVASRCRVAGWTVAVVDSRPFGGTCALRGCDPKKVLVGAAEAMDWTRRLRGKGVQTDDARIDWSQLIAFKRSIIASVPTSRENGFATQGIEAFHGHATFTSPATVAVGAETLEGRHILIAAGAKAVDVRIPGPSGCD